MNDYIIETHNLTKKYGNQTSVSQLNIHVKKGRIYGLLGRNGAGKTTTMRMLVGLTAPTSGEAVVLGMLLLLPCILGIVAAILIFMERDNDTFKNLRTIPITSLQMIVVKCIVLLLLSIVFCVSSTVASILCGFVFFGVTDILFKLLFSAIYGLLIAISALPLVLLIIFFSRSYIFSIMLCVFYSVFNLLSAFSMTALPKWLVLTLPTPSIMMWGTEQMSSRITVSDTEDLQKFVQMELVPSTPQLIVTLGAIGADSLLLAVCLYTKRSE